MMNTFKIKIPVLLVLFLGLFLIACNEETAVDLPESNNLDVEISEDEAYYLTAADTREETDEAHPTPFRHKKLCIKPVFPLTLEFPNDSTVEVNSLRELKHMLHQWRRSGHDGMPQIVFPHDVELPDGSIVTVESRKEIRALLHQCLTDRAPNLSDCYKIVFPIEVDLGNGTTQTVNSRAELAKLIRERHQNTNDSLHRPQIIFPIEIVNAEGTLATIESARELVRLNKSCLPTPRKCFSWVYPIAIELPNGDTVRIRSERELRQLMLRYAKTNTNDRQPQILFPQKVELHNGKIVEINSLREYRRLIAHCTRRIGRRG